MGATEGTGVSRDESSRAHEKGAQALYLAGRYAEAREANLAESKAAAQRGAPEAALHARRHAANCAYRLGQYDVAIAELAAVISEASEPGREQPALVRACQNHLGNALRAVGRMAEALALFERALEAAELSQDREAQCRLEASLGAARDELGEHQAAVAHYKHYHALAVQLRDKGRIARAEDHLGRHDLKAGRIDQARARFVRAMDVARDSGDRNVEATATLHLAQVHLMEGAVEEALRRFTEALELSRRAGHKKREGEMLLARAAAHARRSDHVAAIEDLDGAMALALETKVPRLQARVQWERGRTLLALECAVLAVQAFGAASVTYTRLLASIEPRSAPAYREACDEIAALAEDVVAELEADDYRTEAIRALQLSLASLDAAMPGGERLPRAMKRLVVQEQRKLEAKRELAAREREMRVLEHRVEVLEHRVHVLEAVIATGSSDAEIERHLGDIAAQAAQGLLRRAQQRWSKDLLPDRYDQLERRSREDLELADLLHLRLKIGLEVAAFLLLRVVERELRDKLLMPHRAPRGNTVSGGETAASVWFDGTPIKRVPTLGDFIGIVRSATGRPREGSRSVQLARFIGPAHRERLSQIAQFLDVTLGGDHAGLSVVQIRNKLVHGDEVCGLDTSGHRITPEWIERFELTLTVEAPRMLRALLEIHEELAQRPGSATGHGGA